LDTYDRFNCNQVIFIGDIIDNHYSSYHETDPNGMGGGYELKQAIKHVAKWADAFPVADVIIGNHDRLIMRKAFSSSIPKEWIKDYNDVLGTSWNWVERIEYDGVQFCHGEGGTARTKAKNDMQSTVQGHIHTSAYVDWMVGNSFKIFGMQVGCGVDSNQLRGSIREALQTASDWMRGCNWRTYGYQYFNGFMRWKGNHLKTPS
jgi:metallophosphoesterase superfamily enzyme